jgi:hypothetical protein
MFVSEIAAITDANAEQNAMIPHNVKQRAAKPSSEFEAFDPPG